MLIEYKYEEAINPDYIVSANVRKERDYHSGRIIEVIEFTDYCGVTHKYQGTMEEFLQLINGGARR